MGSEVSPLPTPETVLSSARSHAPGRGATRLVAPASILSSALALLAGSLLAMGTARVAGPDDEPWDLKAPDPRIPLVPETLTGLEDLECTPCHGDIVEQWASTAHALAWRDEVYRAAIAERKRPELCHACHVPRPLLAQARLRRPKARKEDRHLGVSCDTCHRGADGTLLGPRGAETDAHPTGRWESLVEEGGGGIDALCATCHSTNIGPVIGVAKDFQASDQAGRGRSCVGCHMAPIELEDGRVVRSHALQTPRDPTFLRRAFQATLTVEGGRTRVVIANRAGHRVPGLVGRTIRFEARLVDPQGEVLARSSLTLDVRQHLPVDGTVELELDGARGTVELTGHHHDPRQAQEILFLRQSLEP